MAKLKLQMKSSDVLGVHSRVDISFNGVKVGENIELPTTPSVLEYDVTVSTDAENTIKFDLLNDQAYDSNNDGDYSDSDAGDQVMTAIVTQVEYSLDGSTFTAILPQVQSTFTIPSGTNAGMVVELKPAINEFVVWGTAHLIKFTTTGGLAENKTSNKQPTNPISTVIDGNKIAYTDGNTYDFDGNIV